MIYLIDDKKNRQIGYGWSNEKFAYYENYIMPVYDYDQIIKNNLREKIFSANSVVLFHESFFDAALNNHSKDSIEIRTQLEKYSFESEDFLVAFFSGSKNSRSHDKNVINLPVGTFYGNLETFIKKYAEGKSDLRFLLFGENPDIEEILNQKYQEANQNIDSQLQYSSKSLNLYLRTYNNFIQKPLLNFDQQTLINVSDKDLSKYISNWLNKKEYNNIFIPLCFGPVLSDYNGLRMALHIRTTKTLSQFANIYIYGFVDHSFLINCDYFDVLKTKNVNLIDYRKSSFRDAIFEKKNEMIKSELSFELEKIRMNPPKDYEDSHSISNEWSIIRWFKTLEATGIIDYIPDEIESIETNVNSNLYYKFLTNKFPIDQGFSIPLADLKLKHTGKLLYIDDEIDKGWNDLLCTLLWDDKINKVDIYESLGSDFQGLDKQEIIDVSVQKAKSFDLIILDFRLSQEDFNETNPKKITAFQILEKIKEYNKGIQVIIFSASNKIWNLQALQNSGADGFIIKESPENSFDKEFTTQSIKNMMSTIDKCFKMSFLKIFNEVLDAVQSHFDENSATTFNNETKLIENNYTRFQIETFNQLTIAYDCLKNTKSKDLSQKYSDLALVSIYKILELINKEFIHDKSKITKRFDGTSLDGKDPSTLDKISYVIHNEFKLDINQIIGKLKIYHDMRNDIIHPKKINRQEKPIPSDCVDFGKIIKQLVYKTK